MNISNRSHKSKEKFADSLMSIANTIHSAVFVSVLVLPLTAFLTAIFGSQEPFSFIAMINRMTWANVAVFAFVYFVPIVAGVKAKEKAMDLYDEVASSSTSSSFRPFGPPPDGLVRPPHMKALKHKSNGPAND